MIEGVKTSLYLPKDRLETLDLPRAELENGKGMFFRQFNLLWRDARMLVQGFQLVKLFLS